MSADRESAGRPLAAFFGALLFLALLSLTLSYVAVPIRWLEVVGLGVAAVFVGLPIAAVFAVGIWSWSPSKAVLFVVVGALAQAGPPVLAHFAGGVGTAPAMFALSQIGLITWTTGLGALLATLLRDKNLLIPVSLFLAAFDIFLVLTPMGFTRQIIEQAPETLAKVAWAIPAASSAPTVGPVTPMAHIGPADFVFAAMFSVALVRFDLRHRATMIWLVPALIAYLGIVYFVGPLPALVPIGVCVLAVNAPEFKLSAQEWLGTALVVLIAGLLIGWSVWRGRPSGPSSGAPNPAGSGSAGSPEPAIPNPPP